MIMIKYELTLAIYKKLDASAIKIGLSVDSNETISTGSFVSPR